MASEQISTTVRHHSLRQRDERFYRGGWAGLWPRGYRVGMHSLPLRSTGWVGPRDPGPVCGRCQDHVWCKRWGTMGRMWPHKVTWGGYDNGHVDWHYESTALLSAMTTWGRHPLFTIPLLAPQWQQRWGGLAALSALLLHSQAPWQTCYGVESVRGHPASRNCKCGFTQFTSPQHLCPGIYYLEEKKKGLAIFSIFSLWHTYTVISQMLNLHGHIKIWEGQGRGHRLP